MKGFVFNRLTKWGEFFYLAFLMIACLKGQVLESLPNRLVLDVSGVGYQVLIPLSTFDQLNPVEGEEVMVRTYLHVRENLMVLYGFATVEEKDLFLLLIERVTGIGPSIGMAILSGMPVEDFKGAVVNGDIAVLSKVKGLGKKTAERIVLELKDKVGVAEAWQASSAGGESANRAASDAELALIALGYKQADAKKSVGAALKADASLEADELIRNALRGMN